ncbi:ATP-binding cassette domain-containing protein [Halocella sp. SP3-1]|nr:ATP-binding cassette domain-containing protein [Halocella sp. SP3-1]AZO96685.1 ATP-binding cassette domain-containing protein [Halocella sp. SP3-1]
MGKNGIGKSLLLKIILGREELTAGEIIRATALDIGYFSQKLVNLHDD